MGVFFLAFLLVDSAVLKNQFDMLEETEQAEPTVEDISELHSTDIASSTNVKNMLMLEVQKRLDGVDSAPLESDILIDEIEIKHEETENKHGKKKDMKRRRKFFMRVVR